MLALACRDETIVSGRLVSPSYYYTRPALRHARASAPRRHFCRYRDYDMAFDARHDVFGISALKSPARHAGIILI